ncbi:hypothetical protein RQP46_010088 [Phenoliferia psychrophenolica]
MSSLIEEYLLNILDSAPAGSNPYLVLLAGIDSFLPGPFDDNFRYQLYALSAAFGLIPAWIGGWVATWCLGTSYLINLHARGVDTTSVLTKPAVVNTFVLVVPALFTASTLATGLTTSNIILKAIGMFEDVTQALQAGAASFQGEFQLSDLAPEIATFAKTEALVGPMILRLQVAAGLLFTWGFLLLIAICVVSFYELRSIRKALNKTTPWSGTTEGSNENSTIDPTPLHQSVVRRSVGSLILTVSAFIMMDSV